MKTKTKINQPTCTQNPDRINKILRDSKKGSRRNRANPVVFYLAALLFMALSISFANAQNVNVSGSTGADGTYATLSAAFTQINASSQGGNNIQVNIVASTNEAAATATLNNQGWTTLTVNPVGTVSVSGATTAGSALIDLNGATNV